MKINANININNVLYPIVTLKGTTDLCKVYSFLLTIKITNYSTIENFLAQDATICLYNDKNKIFYSGYIDKAKIDTEKLPAFLIEIKLNSIFNKLDYQKGFGIFQDKNALECIEEKLCQHGLYKRFINLCRNSYKKSDLWIQDKKESDLQFITRIASESGLYWRSITINEKEYFEVFDDSVFSAEYISQNKNINVYRANCAEIANNDFAGSFDFKWEINRSSNNISVFDYDIDDAKFLHSQCRIGEEKNNNDLEWFVNVGSSQNDIYNLSKNISEYYSSKINIANLTTNLLNIYYGRKLCLNFLSVEERELYRENKFFITKVEHEFVNNELEDGGIYKNFIEMIPDNIQFRNFQVNLEKSVDNKIALIDGIAEEHSCAYLNNKGDYKILFFDSFEKNKSGFNSSWVERLQSFSYSTDKLKNCGWHMPLLKNTEIAIGFLHNNIAKPFIIGSINNSLVTSKNINEYLIRTKGNNQFLFDDKDKKIELSTRDKENILNLSKKNGVEIISERGAINFDAGNEICFFSNNDINKSEKNRFDIAKEHCNYGSYTSNLNYKVMEELIVKSTFNINYLTDGNIYFDSNENLHASSNKNINIVAENNNLVMKSSFGNINLVSSEDVTINGYGKGDILFGCYKDSNFTGIRLTENGHIIIYGEDITLSSNNILLQGKIEHKDFHINLPDIKNVDTLNLQHPIDFDLNYKDFHFSGNITGHSNLYIMDEFEVLADEPFEIMKNFNCRINLKNKESDYVISLSDSKLNSDLDKLNINIDDISAIDFFTKNKILK